MDNFKPKKNYALSPTEIKPLISSQKGCFATDRITVDGCKVGFMYRVEPDSDFPDSGWRFTAGDESDEYMENSENIAIYQLNTICNYDPEILPFLDAATGVAFIRDTDGNLIQDPYWSQPDDCD